MFKFVKPRRPVNRAFVHCSASDHAHHDNVATMRNWHTWPKPKGRGWSDTGYHFFGPRDGSVEFGRPVGKTPAAQGGHNRGTLAYCVHGLTKSKFTEAQIDALRDWAVQVNEAYDGKITFHGHNEVANKACPVLDYKAILKLDDKGRLGISRKDIKRGAKSNDIPDLSILEEPDAKPSILPVLRYGDKGEPVKFLQAEMKRFGYHTGAVDGHFGNMTRASVLAFQEENYLIADGIVGNATYEAMEDAEAREISKDRAKKSVASLAVDGSRIAQASMAQGFMGSTFTAGGAIALLEENTGMVTKLANGVGTYSGVIKSLGPWIGAAVVIGGLVILFQAIKAGRARREDHRTGRTA